MPHTVKRFLQSGMIICLRLLGERDNPLKTKGKPENVLLTIPEVAALARVTRKIIWQRVRDGRIPAYKVADSPILRVWLSDVLVPYLPGEPIRPTRKHLHPSGQPESTEVEPETVDITTPVNIVDTTQS